MSPRSSQNAKRPSRRKAGRRAAPKAKRRSTFRLTVEAQEMLVTYTRHWSNFEGWLDHFEFRSPHETPRRIPVSTTGYLSHFVPSEEVAQARTPQDYARAFVERTIGDTRSAMRSSSNERQLSLF